MSQEEFLTALESRDLWLGVAGSTISTALVAFLAFAFQGSLKLYFQFSGEKEKNEAFEQSLNSSSPLAPFAFGIVQAKALRLFFMAVFFAYISDLFGLILWPINLMGYIVSLWFLFLALKWLNKLEGRALELLRKGS